MGSFSLSGTETLKFLGPKIWALVPNEIKQIEILEKFRNARKQWKPKPVLAVYAKDIFIGLVSLIKNYFKE